MRTIIIAANLVLLAVATQAGTLITVTNPVGSRGTHVLAINDDNIIAGGYVTVDGVEHGFFGPLNGSYSSFDDGNGTEAESLNIGGFITGFAPTDSCNLNNCTEFVRAPDGTQSVVTKDGVVLNGFQIGINKKNLIVGTYYNGSVWKGYKGKNAKYATDITLQTPHTGLYPSAINTSGDIAGYFLNGQRQSGFLLSAGTEIVIQDPSPGAVKTVVWGLNDEDVVAGSWKDSSNNYHPFYYNPSTNTFTEITVPGSNSTIAKGINSAGLVTLYTVPDGKSYIYCPLKKKKCPGGVGTMALEKTIHAEQIKKNSD